MLRLNRAGIKPKKHVMDNEVSNSMKTLIKDDYKMELELVPPGCHRRNAAEVAIRNFKAHFLSILAGTADDFPLTLWDRLLPQAEITLNLLRQANANPKLSAYAYMCGPFDYNRMPLAPMGCKVQIHERPANRGTWDFHSVDRWYLHTSNEHYRTHKCHVKGTRSERLSDTVQFLCKSITNPTKTVADKIMLAISHVADLVEDKGKNKEAEKAVRELERLVRATNQAEQAGTLNKTCKDDDSSALPRVQEDATKQTPEDYEYIDPERPITRSMSHLIEEKDIKVDEIPSIKDQVPRVDSKMDQATKPSLAEKKQAIPRVAKQNKPKKAKPKVTNTEPIATRTRSKKASSEPIASRTRSKKAERRGQRAAKRIAAAVRTVPSERSDKQRSMLRTLHRKLERVADEVEKAMAVMDQATGKMLNYRQLQRDPKYSADWNVSAANEFGRLANGVGGRVKGTKTIKFIRKRDVPKGRLKDVTYGSFLCTIRPEKKEKNRTRFTVGGDRINYPGRVETPTADMLVAKLLFNSVVSTKGARFMTADISNFYLNTPLKRPEYIRLSLKDVPEEIIKEYKLRNIAEDNGSIYIEVTKGMYGLPQSGRLANKLLENRLNKHGYHQSKYVPGLWKHEKRNIQFTLVVDDFGVKYVRKEDAEHLMKVLKKYYPVSEEWTGTRYIGITLDWDYEKRQVHLTMPGYVAKALKQFQHDKPRKRQDSPFQYTEPTYGAKKQYAQKESTAPELDKKGKLFIQQVCGKFLFYGRAVDSTILTAISAIASQQAKPTEDTMKQTKQLLDYLASQEEAVLTYSASEMILAVHSDASYLNEPKARSRAGGHFFMSTNSDIPPNNGAILNIAHIIKHVMASATEAELAAL